MAKKLGILLLTAALLTAMCAAAFATTYYVTGDNVRLRSGPGTDYGILSHLSRGAKIDVKSTDNGWARTTLRDGTKAYISTKFISRTKPSTTSYTNNVSTTTEAADYKNFTSVNYDVIVNPVNGYVNMRWEATKASPVKKVYYYGSRLHVIAENANWCQVIDTTTNDVGFILKSLLLRAETDLAAN